MEPWPWKLHLWGIKVRDTVDWFNCSRCCRPRLTSIRSKIWNTLNVLYFNFWRSIGGIKGPWDLCSPFHIACYLSSFTFYIQYILELICYCGGCHHYHQSFSGYTNFGACHPRWIISQPSIINVCKYVVTFLIWFEVIYEGFLSCVRH